MIRRYRNGAEAKTIPEINRNFFRPYTSESEAAGKLTKIPGIVDAEATKPVQFVGVPRLNAKGFRTGFFDIVELRIAKKPIMQSVKKTVFSVFLDISICEPA